jgi:hypothetical protein
LWSPDNDAVKAPTAPPATKQMIAVASNAGTFAPAIFHLRRKEE